MRSFFPAVRQNISVLFCHHHYPSIHNCFVLLEELPKYIEGKRIIKLDLRLSLVKSYRNTKVPESDCSGSSEIMQHTAKS